MFSNMKDKSALEIVNQFAGKDNIEDLFDLSDYNTTQWADDFTSAANGQFYTQRVYIYREEKSTDLICDYKAPTDQSSVLKRAKTSFPMKVSRKIFSVILKIKPDGAEKKWSN